MTKKRREPKGFNWWTDGSALGLLGGFGATYMALVPLSNHPLHWLLSVLGAFGGYAAGLLFSVRHRLAARLKQGWSLIRKGPTRNR